MARYIEQEKAEEKAIKGWESSVERYALERKYNKCSPHEFFNYLIDYINTPRPFAHNKPKPKNPIDYLYLSANKSSWEELESFLTKPKWTESKKKQLINLVRLILKKSPNYILLTENIKALKGIAELYEDRLRDIEDWKPKRINTHAQLPDLLRHLFAKYPVPAFLINGFRSYHLDAILLYQHIGLGKSLKSFELIPEFNIPKKAYHHLQTTPDDCTYNEAFRRAQILNMGGDERLFHTLMGSRIGNITNTPNTHKPTRLEQEEFWLTVIRFFVDHPMINNDKIPQIIDYIYDQKFTLKRINQPDGTFVNRAEQPNFSMKGRTPMSLINQSDNWHEFLALNRKREKTATHWEPVNISDCHYANGENKYDVVQLTSTKELIAEGNAMHNCVATYASSCINKSCSIFSLRHTNHYLRCYDTSHVTIEVRQKSIFQVRGRYNKPPNNTYLKYIYGWIDQNNLKISRYVTL